jgi:hypothetical protein
MRWQVLLVILIRASFFLLFLVGLNHIETLGTNPLLLACCSTLGVVVASILAFSRLSTLGITLLSLLLATGFYALRFLSSFSPLEGAVEILLPYTFALHGELLLICFLLGGLSTWVFWRFRDTPTIELFILLGTSIFSLSGHREFRLDNPQALSSLAWSLGIDQVYMLSIVGFIIIITTLLYLSLAGLPVRQSIIDRWQHYSINHGRRSLILSGGFLISLSLLALLSFSAVYQFFHKASLARIGNGVGEGNQEGLSPLGFSSALGSTNQPAALVRLDGDYRENPFTPMLYIRENALSEYNGHEMVIADNSYDTDIPGSAPTEPYNGEEDADLTARVPLNHSIYLLAEHKLSMAVDYPLTIRPLKNPNPAKFKGSFRAYSMAPGFTKEIMEAASVGDPRWSPEVKAHYLKTNSDPRYQELAEKITGQKTESLERAFALTQFLSQKAIYTLTPNHEVNKDADQTAPFLFGDLRGYCVHFAHAMVYMLRSLGIPARIGTGYLTDLSQSKDGHILLRMSDRHAWSEVYVTGLGWLPFDIQPEQVENHADTQVDLKLLEDLMGLLEPDEEILPKELTENEPSFEKEWDFAFPHFSKKFIAICCLALLALLVLLKLYLRYGWIVTFSPKSRALASYRSIVTRISDLGYKRLRGETRSEYRQRISPLVGGDALSSTDIISALNYRAPDLSLPSVAEIDQRRNNDLTALSGIKPRHRILSFFNPASLSSLFFRGSW